MKKILSTLCAVALALTLPVLFPSCQDEASTDLGAVTNIEWSPTSGGAIITFTAPKNDNLLYVKAVYVNSLGNEVFNVASIYENRIEIGGLVDDSREYPVNLFAVDKNGAESPVATVNVRPGQSYINIVYANLTMTEIVGGVQVEWTNPSGAATGGKPVYITINYTDENGKTQTRYISSSQESVTLKVRGIDPGDYNFSYTVEDAMGNKTPESQPIAMTMREELTIPKYVDDANGFRTYLWTLVPGQTTLRQVYENLNAAIFDGVIDTKESASDNSYMGTNRDQYGGTLPWNSDQMDIVIDMQETYVISRIRAWQRAHWYGWNEYTDWGDGGAWVTDGTSPDPFFYRYSNIKSFSLYGSMTGEANDWFIIENCDIATNTTAGALPQWGSGDWYGNSNAWMPTAVSMNAALEGHLWELPTMSDPCRYIRLRFTSTWDMSQAEASGLSELTLYGAIAE
ncbi:MAG: DUF4959 domain-containing protein [Mediterranea sp.]|jgi:hypothetical protein|nr:DUF4959 domain-containing protein [Mediterranea sp.]